MESKYTKESLGFKVGDKININYYANEKEGMVTLNNAKLLLIEEKFILITINNVPQRFSAKIKYDDIQEISKAEGK